MSTALQETAVVALDRIWGAEPPPLSERGPSVIDSLQSAYRLQLPDDFAEYTGRHAPAEDWWDGNAFSWWAPERIKSLRDECGPAPPSDQLNREIEDEADCHLVFADFMVCCYAYAICCSQGPNRGKVALVGGQPDGFVASSFSEFLALAAEDSLLLHAPASPR